MILRKIKPHIKMALRTAHDYWTGDRHYFCQKRVLNDDFKYSLTFQQEIKPSATLANKVYNLKTAADKINHYIMLPNEIFSFWHSIGNPERQFKASRSIIGGQTVNQIGGGICQVSGLIHFAAMRTRLDILERHHHSLDLYTDETRFAPLGTDATVVYGYKDLRLRNPYDFPIKFELSVEENGTILQLNMLSEQPLIDYALKFQTHQDQHATEVWVYYLDGMMINHSCYAHLGR